ncbi:unnamed protein product [Staurois parvus]|uniref:Uncharacterized protein n=1 Tax=Staurois parvus TaxID=386267 RepID=A0ABN9E922_9NEOB|nr:unnamed protein product [Staurois parvus]
MCPLQRPRPSPPADAGFRVPVPVTSGCTGGGKFDIFFKNFIFFKMIITYALSCALPAF